MTDEKRIADIKDALSGLMTTKAGRGEYVTLKQVKDPTLKKALTKAIDELNKTAVVVPEVEGHYEFSDIEAVYASKTDHTVIGYLVEGSFELSDEHEAESFTFAIALDPQGKRLFSDAAHDGDMGF